jgi:choice-of-anchor B domain-containing protein
MRSTVLLFSLFLFFSADQATAQDVPCVAGKITSPASGQVHDCNGVTLLAHVLPSEMGQTVSQNDIWGWSDTESDLEVILAGWKDGVSVLDVTDPSNPKYVALIPKTAGTNGSSWRDIKVYKHYAYIVSEASGHGVQVVDLSVLRGHTGDRTVLLPVTTYTELKRAHNIVINEATGFAYAVGVSGEGTTCGGGLHAIDLASPEAPVFAGCITDLRTSRGYTHDAECVVYSGPDLDHIGKEICIGSNENAISIMDVTDKANPAYLGLGTYATAQYVHQAWLSEDQKYLFQNDELDEYRLPGLIDNTRTLVWDVEDLDDPVLLTEYFSANTSIDHNMYVRGNLLFQSNYIDGLHVLDITDPANMSEKAFFDTHPATFTSVWDGTWSNYPYLRSGAIAVHSDPEGIFMVCMSGQTCTNPSAVDLEDPAQIPEQVQLDPAYPNPFNPQTNIRYALPSAMKIRISVSDALGREVALLVDSPEMAAGSYTVQFDGTGLPSGTYLIRLESEAGIQTRQVVLLK